MSTTRLVAKALDAPDMPAAMAERPCRLVAAGKASPFMARALVEASRAPILEGIVVGTHCPVPLPPALECIPSSHPVPDQRSAEAGARALSVARATLPDQLLVVLLSGGASSLLASPRPGVSLEDKRQATRTLLLDGADIGELNVVRKHLSNLKGGQLAAAAPRTLALVVSDVVSNDLAVIASGPTVGDPSSFREAWVVIERHGGPSAFPRSVVELFRRGMAGEEPETPEPGDPRLANSVTRIIGSRHDAVRGAAAAAASLGYEVVLLPDPIVGEARDAGARFAQEALIAGARFGGRRVCAIGSGETTVKVTGDGRGGRNQELALAAALRLEGTSAPVTVLSGGTDGVDGPTDAAGALASAETVAAARTLGRDPLAALARNDAYTFFEALGGLLITGPTDTNVGDMQLALFG